MINGSSLLYRELFLKMIKQGAKKINVLWDIPITDEFFYKTITCDKNCTTCDFCEQYYLDHANSK